MFTIAELRVQDTAFENWFEKNYGNMTTKPEWNPIKEAFKEVALRAFEAGIIHANQVSEMNWDF